MKNWVGVLLVNMREQKYYSSFGSKLFLRGTLFIINQIYESKGSEYDHVNKKMIEELKRTEQVDGN